MTKITRLEFMKRASFTKFEKKMILKFDLSNIESMDDVANVITFFFSTVERMPKKSLVGLVDFTGLKVSDDVVQEMIRLTEFCNPYFRATAVIANDHSSISLAKSVVNHYDGKINLPIYQDEEAAKKWLYTQ